MSTTSTTQQRQIIIFDTTLRDGEQSPGCSMNLDEKLEVAQALVDLGVDVIEAGFPIASPGDFEAVREIARTVLVAHGFTAAVAADGQEGLLHYMKHRDLVKVVVTDMMMPGIQGSEVIAELQHLNPDIRVVAMSGIAAELAALPKRPGRLTLLPKPMTAHQLIHAVQSVMPVTAAPGGQG